MSYYLVSAPERMPTVTAQSEGDTFDIVVDTENDRVEFRSAGGKSVISLDLICAVEVADTLCRLVSGKDFQMALAKNVSEHLGRHNTNNSPSS